MPTRNDYRFLRNAVLLALKESDTIEEAEEKIKGLFDMDSDD